MTAETKSAKTAVAAILLVSAAAAQAGQRLGFLPALNALLNGLCAVALVVGYFQIRAGNRRAHRTAMLAAFGFSTLFLAGYILHHALHGDVRYPVDAPWRMIYLPLLASHILLAIVALPLVLASFFFSLTGRIATHRKVARWTLPLWLYVSGTGVITWVMLRLARG
jgi:putative membrane protein